MDIKTLTNIGLSEEEAKIYYCLLENGELQAAKIATKTGIKRTYTYSLVKQLKKKGLVEISPSKKTQAFKAVSPDHLVPILEEKRLLLSVAQKNLEEMLPKLKDKYFASQDRPIITFLEGIEGVKRAYLDLLEVGEPISALVQTSQVDPELYKWLTSEFVEKRIKLKIPVRSIVTSGKKTEDYINKNEKEFRETKEVSSDMFPFEHEIDVYGNKVSILNNKDGEKLSAIIIENPLVAKTFKAWFELAWRANTSIVGGSVISLP